MLIKSLEFREAKVCSARGKEKKKKERKEERSKKAEQKEEVISLIERSRRRGSFITVKIMLSALVSSSFEPKEVN